MKYKLTILETVMNIYTMLAVVLILKKTLMIILEAFADFRR